VTVADALLVVQRHLADALGHGSFKEIEDLSALTSPAVLAAGQ
jgi:hypothetical protein